MLPNRYRLRNSADFTQVVRKGGRSGNKFLVVHHLADQFGAYAPLVGFVVSKKSISRAVDRNRIKRQLREIVFKHIECLPKGSATVIRVLGECKGKNSEILSKNFLTALDNAKKSAERKNGSIKRKEDEANLSLNPENEME